MFKRNFVFFTLLVSILTVFLARPAHALAPGSYIVTLEFDRIVELDLLPGGAIEVTALSGNVQNFTFPPPLGIYQEIDGLYVFGNFDYLISEVSTQSLHTIWRIDDIILLEIDDQTAEGLGPITLKEVPPVPEPTTLIPFLSVFLLGGIVVRLRSNLVH